MSKIEAFWVNATADDVARVMAGETVEARFRDSESVKWFISELAGWTAGMIQWYSTDDDFWTHCQVYREPSWYTKRPDPGPGFRLLEKFPDEELKPGDEAWDMWSDKQWADSDNAYGGKPQSEEIWYRRRIEPVEPEPKHYVLRVGDTVETPSGHKIKAVIPGVEQIEFKLKAGFTAKLPSGQTITATEKGFEVTQ
jgi:hypothetical protein